MQRICSKRCHGSFGQPRQPHRTHSHRTRTALRKYRATGDRAAGVNRTVSRDPGNAEARGA